MSPSRDPGPLCDHVATTLVADVVWIEPTVGDSPNVRDAVGGAIGDHRRNPFLTTDVDGAPARIVTKTALSLHALLRKHRAPRRIDFMSIGGEGSEWQMLAPFPFERYEVRARCVHSKFRWDGRLVDTDNAERIRGLLVGHRYFYDRERSRTAEHDFFVYPALVAPPWARSSALARAGANARGAARRARAWLGCGKGRRR